MRLKVITGMVTCPLAQLDIASLPRAFVPRLFKFSFALDVCCSRDTQAENSLSRDAEFATAGLASKTTSSRAFLSVPESRALCVPQRTVLRASSDPRTLRWKRQPRQPPPRRLGALEHPCPWHSPRYRRLRLRELRSSHHPCGSPSTIELALLVKYLISIV